MSWRPISYTIPQYHVSGEPASGYYLKGYAAGTTTPISMASDNSGAGLLAKCQLDVNGYPLNGSSAPFVPYFNQAYKLALYTNSADADADNTGAAAWILDDFAVESVSAWKEADTAIYLSATSYRYENVDKTASLSEGQMVYLQGGADRYARIKSFSFATHTDVVVENVRDSANAASTIHVSTTSASLSFQTLNSDGATVPYYPIRADLGETGVVNTTYPVGHVRRYGAEEDGTTDDYTAVVNAFSASDIAYITSDKTVKIGTELNLTGSQSLVSTGRRSAKLTGDIAVIVRLSSLDNRISNIEVLAGTGTTDCVVFNSNGTHVGNITAYNTLENVLITGNGITGANGIYFDATDAKPTLWNTLHNVIIRNCKSGLKFETNDVTGSATSYNNSNLFTNIDIHTVAKGIEVIASAGGDFNANLFHGLDIGAASTNEIDFGTGVSTRNIFNGYMSWDFTGGTRINDASATSVAGTIIQGDGTTTTYALGAGVNATYVGRHKRPDSAGSVFQEWSNSAISINVGLDSGKSGTPFYIGRQVYSEAAALAAYHGVVTGITSGAILERGEAGNIFLQLKNNTITSNFGINAGLTNSPISTDRALAIQETTAYDFAGSGSPEGVVTAGIGSTYRRTDGGASTSFYVKESGTGNTGWVAK